MDRQVEALAELKRGVDGYAGERDADYQAGWDDAIDEAVRVLAHLNDEAERGERCEDCGHPPEHHLDEHGCYCGCRERFAAVQSKGGPE